MTEDAATRAKRMVTEAATLAGGAAAGVVNTLATTPDPSMAATAAGGAIGLLAPALVMLVGIGLRWKEHAAAQWWHALLSAHVDSEVTAEEIAGTIDAHQEEPFVRETILRSVRTLQDALDPAVTVPLAALGQEYLGGKKSPDRFFRGTCRLLQDISADELAQLNRCFAMIERTPQHMGGYRVLRDFTDPTRGGPVQMQATGAAGSAWEDCPDVRLFLRLLVRCDLATEIGTVGGSVAGEVVRIECATSARLRRIFNAATS